MCGLQTFIKAFVLLFLFVLSCTGVTINAEMLQVCLPTLMSGGPGVKGREFNTWLGASSCVPAVSQSLAPLALVLAAGRLTLDLPGALLVRAVADRALVDLHLSASRYHRCVRVAIWPCVCERGNEKKEKKNKKSGAKQENATQCVSKLNLKLALCIFNAFLLCCQHHVTLSRSDSEH